MPAAFAQSFLKFAEAQENDKLKSLSWLKQYKLLKRRNDKVECEDITHYLLANNLAICHKEVTLHSLDYMACPTSLFQRISCDTVDHFLSHCLKTIVED